MENCQEKLVQEDTSEATVEKLLELRNVTDETRTQYQKQLVAFKQMLKDAPKDQTPVELS